MYINEQKVHITSVLPSGHDRRRELRGIRRLLRPRDPHERGHRTRPRIPRFHQRSEFHRRGRPDEPRVHRQAVHALLRGQDDQGPRRGQDLPQEGGPQPHRGAQDQQRHRTVPPGQEDGQDPRHSRDRRRPARRRHRHPRRVPRTGVRGVHGSPRCRETGAERLQDGAPRSEGQRRQGGHRRPQGRRERDIARMDPQGRRHPLRHRHRHGS